ncbi:AAA family ATPase [Candidatus Magnetobacterium casense]|uniref:AAA family ATPase n=1 Tax=Candidatus Magnetobacterium casense TaxID=1455061 RepID=A0ABS6RXA8_9BACT|nr:AAA family ATPase [Candidatus Magnetobacterium casensis]MBV6340428.1 AAA family ATPase [Candidatus Magnetobacterium casensis]
MCGNIERFQIIDLHGYKNLDIKIEDNTIILVGENGSGKTTVLRLLYYFLSGQWSLLVPYKFARLVVTVDGSEHTLPYDSLEKYGSRVKHNFFRHVAPPIRQEFLEFWRRRGGNITPQELEIFCGKYDIPLRYAIKELESNEFELSIKEQGKELEDIYSKLQKSLNTQILYLPTYRRIEQGLKSIFGMSYEKEWRQNRRYIIPQKRSISYVELIEFGMEDVDEAIEENLGELKDFARKTLNSLTLGYLGDVVDERYSEVKIEDIQNKSEEAIKLILNRIQADILSEDQKKHLLDKIEKVKQDGSLKTDEHAKVICHYLLKLLQFQEELSKKESQMRAFCGVCNEYMGDKRLDYDSANFLFSIKLKEPNKTSQDIELEYLSSGEKQIVSLFSHLYLSGEGRYIVIIDEPELSLSLPWQRRFLTDIKNGTFCSGLIVATHSPFVYDNELERYTHGLGEFYE